MGRCGIKHNGEPAWPSVTLSFRKQIFLKEKIKTQVEFEEDNLLNGFY